ncbi:MAG: hypothetical protein M3R14_11205, partial [Acidobacteriota bacterium]|nr:hypothetical protein [Acidobacteriota bacterium]
MNTLKFLFRLALLSVFCILAGAETQAASYLYAINDNTARSQIYGFSVNETTSTLTDQIVQPTNALGATGLVNGIASVNFAPNTIVDAPVDFNGDGKSDFVVARSFGPGSPATWFINYNGSGNNLSQAIQFGSGVG